MNGDLRCDFGERERELFSQLLFSFNKKPQNGVDFLRIWNSQLTIIGTTVTENLTEMPNWTVFTGFYKETERPLIELPNKIGLLYLGHKSKSSWTESRRHSWAGAFAMEILMHRKRWSWEELHQIWVIVWLRVEAQQPRGNMNTDITSAAKPEYPVVDRNPPFTKTVGNFNTLDYLRLSTITGVSVVVGYLSGTIPHFTCSSSTIIYRYVTSEQMPSDLMTVFAVEFID